MSRLSGGEEGRGGKSNQGKVLIVEDEVIIRIFVGRALMKMGYEVEYAKDGVEAIGLYKRALKGSKPFDVVIMDLIFHFGIGGKETIRKLFSIDPKVKGIICSGFLYDPAMSEYKEYGFRDVLSKPYSIKDISETIRKVIDEKLYISKLVQKSTKKLSQNEE
jgi:DNA-binding NtrC family response regulator